MIYQIFHKYKPRSHYVTFAFPLEILDQCIKNENIPLEIVVHYLDNSYVWEYNREEFENYANIEMNYSHNKPKMMVYMPVELLQIFES